MMNQIESLDKLFTISDALTTYFMHGEQRGMKGADRAKQSAAAFIIPAFGDLEVKKLTAKRIENWLYELANSPKRLRTRAGKPQAYATAPQTEDEKRARRDTANRILTILKAALNHAVDKRLIILSDPAWRKVKPFRGTSRPRIRFLQPIEAARLVNSCPPDFKDLVRAALLTGARFGELIRLKARDFNPSHNISTLFVAESKSGKPRHVILTAEGIALFEELTVTKHPDDLIFTRHYVQSQKRDSRGHFAEVDQRTEGAWNHGQNTHYMRQACNAAGLEYISFHELRHTYASMLVNAGCHLVYIASQLGHADTKMVEKHYAHLNDYAKAAAINAAMPVLGIVEPAKIQKLKLG